MNTTTIDADTLLDRYIAVWNETDAARRRDLIARTWTEDAEYLDPVMQGSGHDGIDAMVAGVQERFADHRFEAIGGAEIHNGRARFSWALVPADGDAIVKGTDFAVLAGDRLASVTGFFDLLPGDATR